MFLDKLESEPESGQQEINMSNLDNSLEIAFDQQDLHKKLQEMTLQVNSVAQTINRDIDTNVADLLVKQITR